MTRRTISERFFPDVSMMEQRHALIVEPPPRMTPLETTQVDAEQMRLVAELRSTFGLSSEARLPDYFATMLRHPSLMQQQILFASALYAGSLSARVRELVILRVAWLTSSPYEWGEHVRAGKHTARLSDSDIEQVINGSESTHWSGVDRWVLVAVEELLEDAMISDETWCSLAESLEDQQLIELLVLIGTYVGISYLQNSIRFDLPPENPGLKAR